MNMKDILNIIYRLWIMILLTWAMISLSKGISIFETKVEYETSKPLNIITSTETKEPPNNNINLTISNDTSKVFTINHEFKSENNDDTQLHVGPNNDIIVKSSYYTENNLSTISDEIISEDDMEDGIDIILLSNKKNKITKKKKDKGVIKNYDKELVYSKIPLKKKTIDSLIESCNKYKVPLEIALGLIETESNFNPNSRSGSCYGLCQLHGKYFPTGLSPEDNIKYGLKQLSSNYKKYKTWKKALNAYNAGHVTGNYTYANKVLNKAKSWDLKLRKSDVT